MSAHIKFSIIIQLQNLQLSSAAEWLVGNLHIKYLQRQWLSFIIKTPQPLSPHSTSYNICGSSRLNITTSASYKWTTTQASRVCVQSPPPHTTTTATCLHHHHHTQPPQSCATIPTINQIRTNTGATGVTVLQRSSNLRYGTQGPRQALPLVTKYDMRWWCLRNNYPSLRVNSPSHRANHPNLRVNGPATRQTTPTSGWIALATRQASPAKGQSPSTSGWTAHSQDKQPQTQENHSCHRANHPCHAHSKA